MWSQFYKKGGVRRLMLALTTRAVAGPVLCPYCRDELPVFSDHEDACNQCGTFLHPEPGDFHCEPEPTWTCPRCSTSMHQECYDELSTCTTLGCSGRRPGRPRVTATPRVNLRDANEFLDELNRGQPEWEEPRVMSAPAAAAMLIGLLGLVALAIWLVTLFLAS